MRKWRTWQLIFLIYLLILNIVVFGVLGFVLLTNYILLPTPYQSTPQNIAIGPTDTATTFRQDGASVMPQSTGTNLGPGASNPDAAATSASDTNLTIPPVDIPPASPPNFVEPPANMHGTETNEDTSSLEITSSLTPMPTNTPTATTTPTDTPEPTVTSTRTPTFTPRPTATPTATLEPTLIPTDTPDPTSTSTNTPTATTTPTDTPEPIATSTRTPTFTPRPTATSRPTSTQTNTPTPEPLPTSTPTSTSTSLPTSMATKAFTPSATSIAKTPPPVTASSTPMIEATAVASNLSGIGSNNSSTTALTSGRAETSQALDSVAELIDATSLTNGSIALSWAPLAKSTQYRIYSDMGTGYGLYIYKGITTQPTFIDELLRPNTTYSYRLNQMEDGQEQVLAQIRANALTSDTIGGGQLASRPERFTANVMAVPTALPPDAVLLGLITDNNFTDEFNTLTIVGEMRNDTNLNVGQTDINVTFYDKGGAVIGAANGVTMLEIIPPGEKSPFVITLTRPPGFDSYSLRAVARPIAAQQAAQLSVIEVRRFEDDAGFFHIKGVVKNVGSIIARRIKVSAAIYGRDNSVINIGFTYVDPPTLAPGEEATYDIIFAYYPKYVTQQVIVFEE